MFICYTPFHLLLAATLAAQHDLEPTAILVDEAQFAGLGVRSLELALGLDIVVLPGCDSMGNPHRLLQRTKNARAVVKTAKRAGSTSVVLFNPQLPEALAAARFIGSDVRFAEDGLSAYIRQRQPGALEVARRLVFSAGVLVLPRLSGDNIDAFRWSAAYAMVPEQLYRGRNSTLPPISPVSTELFIEFAQRLLGAVEVSTPVNSLQVIVVLPHPKAKSRVDWARLVRRQTAYCDSTLVGVKPHPRDTTALPPFAERFVRLDRRLPLEALFPLLQPGGAIVGPLSTATLTVKLCRPDATYRVVDYVERESCGDNIPTFLRDGANAATAGTPYP